MVWRGSLKGGELGKRGFDSAIVWGMVLGTALLVFQVLFVLFYMATGEPGAQTVEIFIRGIEESFRQRGWDLFVIYRLWPPVNLDSTKPLDRLLLMVLWGPFWEELVYRGPLRLFLVIKDRFAEMGRRLDFLMKVLLFLLWLSSGLIFGFYHYFNLNLARQVVSTALSGLAFGSVVIWRRSLVAAMIAHATLNFFIWVVLT